MTYYYILYKVTAVSSVKRCSRKTVIWREMKNFTHGGKHMSKKLISVMLALVLVLSALGTVAFAAGTSYEDEESAYSQTWELGTPVDNGDGTWSVDVLLTTDYPTGAIQFIVEETDPGDVVTLKSVVAGDALYYDAQISKNSSGKVLIVPDADADISLVNAQAIDGVIATLTYTYAGTGSASIIIVDDPKSADNASGSLIALRVPGGNLVSSNVVAGQIVNGVGEAQVIGTVAADPELIAKDGTTGYVDADRMYVYGVPAGADPLNYFEATNNGYIEMSTGDASATNGTGATLTLYKDSTKATVVATYTLVIFGDVNGDGNILAGDSTVILNHVSTAAPLTGAFLFAADVNADGNVLAGDSTVVLNHVSTAAIIAANVWAA